MMAELLVALDARLIGTKNTGDSAYWSGLVRGLAKRDDVRVLLFSNAAKPPGIPGALRLEFVHLPGGSRWWSWVRFPLAARRRGAQVVHTQYSLSPLCGSTGVTTIHDVSFFIGPQWFPLGHRLLLRSQVPASVRRASRVLTVSETSKAEIERHIPQARGKVRVTPNALGENIQPMDPSQATQLVGALGVKPPYLLTVGTRWPRKNMKLALEAASLAGQTLVVTGQPGWDEDWPASARSHLRCTGYVDDATLTALYQCASLYLAPSLHEGFGIPLLEAFACGCPVLCSQGGALPEVAGDAAEVVRSWDPAVWSDRIRSLLADSGTLESMRERGRKRLKAFDWDDTARKTMDAYREVAS